MPVRVKKMRPNKDLEHDVVRRPASTFRHHAREALCSKHQEAFALKIEDAAQNVSSAKAISASIRAQCFRRRIKMIGASRRLGGRLAGLLAGAGRSLKWNGPACGGGPAS
jgi:hypothetical protein